MPCAAEHRVRSVSRRRPSRKRRGLALAGVGMLIGCDWLAGARSDEDPPAPEASSELDRGDRPQPSPTSPPASSPTQGAVASAGEPGGEDPSAPGSPGTPTPRPTVRGSATEIPAATEAGTCPEAAAEEIGLLVSPRRPEAGQPLRIVAATLSSEAMVAMRIEDAEGRAVDAEITHYGGVPATTIARLTAPPVRTKLTVVVGREGQGLACRTIKSRHSLHTKVRAVMDDGVWPVRRAWDAGEEALYSAWVRELFHAPRGEELAWSALHEVTTDARRNLLHDHYDWGEDSIPVEAGLYLRPDCADTPYFLRAYFAWKRGLPFGYRRCSRGRGRAPACGRLRGVVGKPENEPESRLPGEMGAVQRFFRRTLAWGVHTGNGRTAFDDDETDFYPLELSRRALRPGVIYADPYGHIFVVAEMMAAQGTEPGVLYAIDGQPDGSITRKRFWEGNFLWNPDPALGGSGFKGFRPPVVRGAGSDRRIEAATNAELTTMAGYGDMALTQATLDAPAFYDRMDGLITPGIRDPFSAQREAIVALHESAKVRVTSVDNGVAYHADTGKEIDMPDGFSIFETTGAWENYSTPARDLRLLIAIDVATGFGDKVARNPGAWGVDASEVPQVRESLAQARDSLLADEAMGFSYTRSDGSTWTLGLADLVARARALEAAYNPNDCPEVRWGAPKGSDERATCRRRAPDQQRRKMAAYRPWFHERRRPPRGDPGPPVE